MSNLWIETKTGKYVYNSENPDDVNIKDISSSLSKLCRFNGHSDKFYTIGQHVLWIREQMKKDGYSPRIQLLGLMHDFHEAYITDVPTPLKSYLKKDFNFDITEVEKIVDNKIYKKFNVELPSDDEIAIVRHYDLKALFVEKRFLFDKYVDWGWGTDYENDIKDEDIISLNVKYITPTNFIAKDIEDTFTELLNELR